MLLLAGEGWRVVTDRYVVGEAVVATDDAEADNNIYIKKHGKVPLLLSLALNEFRSARVWVMGRGNHTYIFHTWESSPFLCTRAFR
jgi:hypothetical protein